MRPFLLWGMSARVEWRGANAVPPAYRPTFYRCKRLTHLPQGPARVFWRSVYRSDLSKEGTWSRKQEVPALDEIFDNPGLTPLMNLPRRVRFKDFINYSDEKAIFVGLNFAIVSLFFQSLAQFKHYVYQLEFVGDEHVLVWPFSLMDATLKDFLILRPTGHLKSCHSSW